ncbi:hypothetical protein QZK23_17635 [Acinetobacter baumannii]|nr:hypothetical protein [Acinetobacter baumannii]
MAVPEQTPFIEYTANGTTTVFPLTFDCDKAEYLIVKLNDEVATTGLWSLTDKSVKFIVAPENGVKVSIQRDTPLERTTDYQLYNNSLQPSAINKDFDAIWRKLQELGYTDSVLLRMIIQEILDRKEGDAFLLAKLAAEELARINADAYLQSQISTSSLDISKLQQKLAKEIIDRIEGDRDAKQYAKDYTDFMITQVDENMPIFDGVADNIVITENGDTQRDLNKYSKRGAINLYDPDFAIKHGYDEGHIIVLNDGSRVRSKIDNNPNDPNSNMTDWDYINVAMNKTYAPVLGSPVKFKLNPFMASLIYGISDPTHLDDNLNNFRGINNPDAYHDSNVAIGAVTFGRNCPPFAYLSLAGGHDCVPFGVASFVFGAGSCTGNPDDPVGSANGVYGYCSLSVGKDTQARGRISNAMGHLNLSESLYSSTDGYKCIAGASKTTDPDYLPDGTQGAAARAHGYQSEAYGNFAFSYGSFLKAFNGAQAIGKGIASGGVIQPLVISKRGVGIGYNVTKPTIFCKEGDGIDLERAWVGFNTDIPMSRYDFRYGVSDTVTHVIESTSGAGLLANEVKGLLANGRYASLHNTIVSHPNAGQAYATIQHRLNGTEYMTVDQTRKVTFAKEIETSSGLHVAGDRVVGGQLPAILDLPASATLEDVIAKVNQILAALRGGTGHGLIAP